MSVPNRCCRLRGVGCPFVATIHASAHSAAYRQSNRSARWLRLTRTRREPSDSLRAGDGGRAFPATFAVRCVPGSPPPECLKHKMAAPLRSFSTACGALAWNERSSPPLPSARLGMSVRGNCPCRRAPGGLPPKHSKRTPSRPPAHPHPPIRAEPPHTLRCAAAPRVLCYHYPSCAGAARALVTPLSAPV